MKGHFITAQTVDEFNGYLHEGEKSDNTKEKYLRDVKAFAEYAGGHGITKETVIAYKQHLIDEGYAARSINSMLASLNALFSFLGWYELRVKSLKVQQQIFCPEEKELTRQEYERLCRTAERKRNERLNLILQTLCGTGIRVSELPFISVEAVRRGEATVSLKGKTRNVFIVRDLQKKLLRYISEHKIRSGCVFVTKTGKPISRTNIWRDMKNLWQKSNVFELVLMIDVIVHNSTKSRDEFESLVRTALGAASVGISPTEFLLSKKGSLIRCFTNYTLLIFKMQQKNK